MTDTIRTYYAQPGNHLEYWSMRLKQHIRDGRIPHAMDHDTE